MDKLILIVIPICVLFAICSCAAGQNNLVSVELKTNELPLTREFTAKEDGVHFIVIEVERSRSTPELLCLFNIGNAESNKRRFGCQNMGQLDSDLIWELSNNNSIIETNVGSSYKYERRGYFKSNSAGKVIGWFCPKPGQRYIIKLKFNKPLPELIASSTRLLVGSIGSAVVGGNVANLDGPLAPRCSP